MLIRYHHQMKGAFRDLSTASSAVISLPSSIRLDRPNGQGPKKAHATKAAVAATAPITMAKSAAPRFCFRKGLKPMTLMISGPGRRSALSKCPISHADTNFYHLSHHNVILLNMFASTNSVALVGVEGRAVRVEAHVGGGEKGRLNVVGLPDTAVREAKDRVMSAMSVAGYRFPPKSVTVNLAPADLPKSGSAYDLPIAMALLAAAGEIPKQVCEVVALGELALDGTIRPARGGLGAAIVASDLKIPCVLPPGPAEEASIVSSAEVRMVRSLTEAIEAALGGSFGQPSPPPEPVDTDRVDLSEVRGQPLAKRALEVAAAGAHHMLVSGPPGAGKTMLVRCLPTVLPTLGESDALQVAQVWSSAGRSRPFLFQPPIRSPHHTATMAAVLGGGSPIPVPGELSLAHRGVLFLDELGEFPPSLLDGLRQPLEEGRITISRKGVSVTFPAMVQLVAATNPCPCGYHGDDRQGCNCSESMVQRYRRRLSGPLMDRFDIRVKVNRVDPDAMIGPPEEPGREVAKRVASAREAQERRGVRNRDLTRTQLDAQNVTVGARRLVEGALRHGGLTGRGFDRVRRLSRTIADLAGSEPVDEPHAAEALALRGLI